MLLSKNFISYLHPIILHLVIVLLWCHCGAWCHSGAGVTPVLMLLRCHSGAGVTPVLVLLWCHSGAGVTPVSLQCWCYSIVTPVLVLLRCWCYSGVTPVLVLLRCHSSAGATPVSLQCWCHSKAGVLPVLLPLGVKKLFKSAINYVQSKIIAQSQLYYQQNMFNCYVCGEFFTRQFSLKRHMKRRHAQPYVESMEENPKNHQFTENGLMLRHPFTMMVAASTGGGKTWLVKNLLENRQQWISPAPQRIIWIYAQWQPLYVEMQRIIKGIEFVKGIPANIEDEQFLNPAIRNLIVIDDLMSEASNDKRICDLFTKGSHHRNLSVICLVQNLYYQGKESRTMSLNSQYLVLFNNPRDQQQVVVLARQMYPGQSEMFLSSYKMATSKPYGYLAIDLKPDTPNDKRLWPNVFEQTSKAPTAEQPYYSEQKTSPEEQTVVDPSSDPNFRKPGHCQSYPLTDLKTYKRGTPPLPFQFSKEPINVEDMASIMARASCDECGLLFETLSDLQNHVRNWCYGQSDRKRPRLESQSSEEEENDNHAFINMANEIKEETQERFKAHVQKYQADGFTLKQAKEEAEMVMLPGDRQMMYKKYLAFLKTLFTFHKSELHRSIVRDIKAEMDKSGDMTAAIRNVLRKRKMEITDFVDTGEESSREESDNEGTDDNNE